MKKSLLGSCVVLVSVLFVGSAVADVLDGVNVSMSKAVEIALQNEKGVVVEAELDHRSNGKLVYEIEVAGSLKSYEIDIDAGSGTVIDKDRHYFRNSRRARRAENANIDISKAIDIALKETAGKTVEAELEWHFGNPVWEVKVASGGQAVEYEIDIQSGHITKKEIDEVFDKFDL